MTTVHLIRHGQTDWNLEKRFQGQSESNLTKLGVNQAKTAGEKLEQIDFDVVYASSSKRASDTATILLNGRKSKLNKMDQLREIYLDKWENTLYSEIEKNKPRQFFNYWNDPSQFHQPGCETFYQLQERAVSVFKSLVNQHSGKQILIVSHGAWIKALLSFIEKRPLKKLWDHPPMANCGHSIIKEVKPEKYKITLYSGEKEW